MKDTKGITLIALIITVIILLILAGTAISIAINGGDLFSKAAESRENWNEAVEQENTSINSVMALLDMAATGEKVESLVGYFADVDGNNTIDGIIYVDLLANDPQSGEWGTQNGQFTITSNVNKTNVKKYEISSEKMTDSRCGNTPRYVVKLASDNTGTESRFYVMGLDNITNGTNSTLSWYNGAMDYTTNNHRMTDYAQTTSSNFGTGATNTANLQAKWDSRSYGSQSTRDLWNWIKTKTGEINEGWFVPSKEEWAAYAKAMNSQGLDSDNYYNTFRLNSTYWTSTQADEGHVWCMTFSSETLSPYCSTDKLLSVRLSTTF